MRFTGQKAPGPMFARREHSSNCEPLVQNPRPFVLPRSPSASAATGHVDDLPIIVHSHLRWDFVWQRPQQILARLASRHAVAFIEEPVATDAETHLAITEPQPNIVRIVPMLHRSEWGDVDAQCARLMPLLTRAFREDARLAGRFDDAIEWFYSPMVARSMLGRLGRAGVVYDCMDELAQFRGAPPDLRRREQELLASADVVFTGGYQLYTRKSQHHDNVHFYGCGVDVDHYARARDPGTVVPADVASLPHPVLGYFGVVDARLAYALSVALADGFPHGSVVIVGPCAKVDPAALPKRANLHWLGQRAYADLPAYTKAFDVCLMPFALNEATENINPTKTLEYMAAGKPVVSTAVPDVVRHFTPIVQVARSPAEFVALAAAAAAHPDPDSIALGIERAQAATWDSIVDAMRGHVLSAVKARQSSPPGPSTAEQEHAR
jgi:glycosyltransferase involved in cell wall biosynthesis